MAKNSTASIEATTPQTQTHAASQSEQTETARRGNSAERGRGRGDLEEARGGTPPAIHVVEKTSKAKTEARRRWKKVRK